MRKDCGRRLLVADSKATRCPHLGLWVDVLMPNHLGVDEITVHQMLLPTPDQNAGNVQRARDGRLCKEQTSS